MLIFNMAINFISFCRALMIFHRKNSDTESDLDPEKEKLLSSASTLNRNGIVPVYGSPVASVNRQ